MRRALTALSLAIPLVLPAHAAQDRATPTTAALLARSRPAEWRTPDPRNLLVMQLPQGRVLIELAPGFTPLHAANIRTLAHEHYFDGLAIDRVQDNFVTQWDDPATDAAKVDPARVRPLGSAKKTLPPEFTRPIDPAMAWTPLPDGDVFAPQVGFSEGFPVARDPASGREWIAHCYGTVGVARDIGPETGNGSALYAVIGQAPRRLDRNLAVAGRVLQGMSYLSALPRGPEPMGFYAHPEQWVRIASVRMASDLPAARRPRIQVLRTDSPTFARMIDAMRHRHDAFYRTEPGHVDLCGISAPVRQTP